MTTLPRSLLALPKPAPVPVADALSAIAGEVRLVGALFLDAELTAPWSFHQGTAHELAELLAPGIDQLLPFHVVTEGQCWLRLDRGDAFQVTAGHALVMPSGDPHVMASDLRVPPVGIERIVPSLEPGVVATSRYGGGGTVTRLICGYLACTDAASTRLFSALPRAFCAPIGDDASAARIRDTIALARVEAATSRLGSACALGKLSELLFLEVFRRYLEARPPDELGWLAGLRDPHVGRALALLHAEPAHPWSLDELGRRVGLSRSALGDRFRTFLGVAPIQYLARVRLQRAARLLDDPAASVADVARLVGFASEAAFSRAFRRAYRASPTHWRSARA